MTSLLFLDVDGVLNTDATYRRTSTSTTFRSGDPVTIYSINLGAPSGTPRIPQMADFESYHAALLEERLVKVLDDIATDHGFEIILSSSWRIFHGCYEGLRDRWLPAKGLSRPIRDKTPNGLTSIPGWGERGALRGEEINAWINQNIPTEQRPETDVLILDDTAFSGSLPNFGKLQRHLIQTSGREGLHPKFRRVVSKRIKTGLLRLKN